MAKILDLRIYITPEIGQACDENMLDLTEFGWMGGLTTYANVCGTIGNDGTWYGYEEGIFGVLLSTTLRNGQVIKALKAKADGSFILTIDTGVQITDVNEVYITSDDGTIRVVLAWDSETGNYIQNNIEEAADMIAANGLDICFGFYALPETFILLKMGEIV